ncbi:MAG: hypothetical protein J6W14_03485 [Clostridia bacterium]|nr:hypothetical protein [Clostridia bacterium]
MHHRTVTVKRALLLLLTLALLLSTLACGKQEEATPTADSATQAATEPPAEIGVPVPIMQNGQCAYTLVFARGGDSLDHALAFRDLFAKATGVTLPYAIDTSTPITEDACEIVIGQTDRDTLLGSLSDPLASDAYIMRLCGNRLWICAAGKAGYDRAFAEFFKLTCNVEDITTMTAQPNATLTLPADLALSAAPSLMLAENMTASGTAYTTEGQSRGAYNYLQFEATLTYRFPTPIGTDFNDYTITYSSNTYLRGELVYTKGGKSYTEQLFLEPGERMSFRSFCDDAMKKARGSAISELRLTPIRAKSAEFMLEDVTVSTRDIPDEVVYLTSDRYRLGIKLTWGGGISYLEDLQDGDNALSNLLNDHDTGRLIQQSYYGTSSAPYTPAQYNGTTWSYNPVQGGDQYNNRSKLIDFRIAEDGQSIYIKCRPLDWAQRNSLTPSYMENTYTIEGGLIRVDNRFVDFSGYTHPSAHQELPAFYTVSYLSDFVYYSGTKAFTGDALTVKKDLPFWGGNSSAYFTPNAKETWCAWVSPEGYGIGVYTPIADLLLAGRHQYNGSRDAHNGATNYVAPLITHQLSSLKPFSYSYYITAGETNEIRNTFTEVYNSEIK